MAGEGEPKPVPIEAVTARRHGQTRRLQGQRRGIARDAQRVGELAALVITPAATTDHRIELGTLRQAMQPRQDEIAATEAQRRETDQILVTRAPELAASLARRESELSAITNLEKASFLSRAESRTTELWWRWRMDSNLRHEGEVPGLAEAMAAGAGDSGSGTMPADIARGRAGSQTQDGAAGEHAEGGRTEKRKLTDPVEESRLIAINLLLDGYSTRDEILEALGPTRRGIPLTIPQARRALSSAITQLRWRDNNSKITLNLTEGITSEALDLFTDEHQGRSNLVHQLVDTRIGYRSSAERKKEISVSEVPVDVSLMDAMRLILRGDTNPDQVLTTISPVLERPEEGYALLIRARDRLEARRSTGITNIAERQLLGLLDRYANATDHNNNRSALTQEFREVLGIATGGVTVLQGLGEGTQDLESLAARASSSATENPAGVGVTNEVFSADNPGTGGAANAAASSTASRGEVAAAVGATDSVAEPASGEAVSADAGRATIEIEHIVDGFVRRLGKILDRIERLPESSWNAEGEMGRTDAYRLLHINGDEIHRAGVGGYISEREATDRNARFPLGEIAAILYMRGHGSDLRTVGGSLTADELKGLRGTIASRAEETYIERQLAKFN